MYNDSYSDGEAKIKCSNTFHTPFIIKNSKNASPRFKTIKNKFLN